MIVADYSQGVASIDLGTGVRTLLLRDNGKTLRGIDGLVRCGATYFGIYNGAAPGRLLLFTVTATGLTFDEPVAGLELPDPTQIAFDGKRLLIVANAGWEAAGKPEAGPRAPALIIAIPLSRDCKPI